LSPQARFGHALAFDLLRGRTVLFGGFNSSGLLADTWEWDGTNWLGLAPVQSPPARAAHTLAFDFLRGQTVLFGGTNNALAPLADTWEWDGTNWAQRLPAASPPSRQNSGLAYDLARGCTSLFAGQNQNGVLDDTWNWNGSNWTQQPAPNLLPRDNAALVYDPIRARTVLFGGSNAAGLPTVPFADTWEWDGTHWFQQTPATSPTPRALHAMAFDSQRGRTLLFGGFDGNVTRFGDTWQWDGSLWTQLAPATSPPARSAHALAFDSVRDRVVLFGGASGVSGSVLGDTWEWDGANWMQRVPAQSPPARHMAALAFDRARGRTVLFGGTDNGLLFADTWKWDGTNWLPGGGAHAPPARAEHALAYDSARGRTLLFSGVGSGPLLDTWEWDGADWTQRATASSPPGPRNGHVLAFDAVRGRTFLFGSGLFTDAWEYGPVAPGAWAPFGTGCAGSAGVPVLTAGSELRPYPGNDLAVEVAPVPANTAVVFSLGLSRTQWGAVSLPLLLDNLGMPGCALLASGDASLLRFATGSVAALTIQIPNNQAFVGLAFYTQAFALDPPANAAGATASNAAAATIGSK
jgi:hypothetical protein